MTSGTSDSSEGASISPLQSATESRSRRRKWPRFWRVSTCDTPADSDASCCPPNHPPKTQNKSYNSVRISCHIGGVGPYYQSDDFTSGTSH